MMQPEELMIGDWVLYKDEPIIVFEIDEYYNRINTEPDGYNAIRCIEVSDIKPIPLTEEILEKNFERDEERFIDCNEFREIEITEYNDGMWQVVIDEIEMSDLPTWKMYVCDVHQLQHALKLFGITKDITL